MALFSCSVLYAEQDASQLFESEVETLIEDEVINGDPNVYTYVACDPLLLGTRRQIKIKNHLKSAAQRENTPIRFGFMLLKCRSKNQNFLKILAGFLHTVWLY